MKIISDERRSGKTIRLVVESYKTKLPIVVLNSLWKNSILDTANWLGLEIPEPITTQDIVNRRRECRDGILVDEGQILLEKLLGVRVQTMTVTKHK